MRHTLSKTLLMSLGASVLLTNTVNAEEKKDVNYEEKLPYMYSDPKWEVYSDGDTGPWPLPKVNPHSTGIYSLAALNTIDFKEDRDAFYEVAPKFKHSGSIEVVYKSNPSAPVTMGFPTGTLVQKLLGGDIVAGFNYNDTSVGAYNNVIAKDELVMDSAQGQWLITNGIYSRDNPDGYGIQAGNNTGSSGSSISTSNLATSPWGLTGSASSIRPEDFLMGVSKAIYGVEQSRPIYIQTTPYRLARKTIWYVWTNPPPPAGDCKTYWRYEAGAFLKQDVTQINSNMRDYTRPGCGQSKYMDRGEYVVHPEGYLNNVWQRYRPDQNVYVSPNVYELYFSKLLQKGILNTDEAFAFIKDKESFVPNKEKAGPFSFDKDFGDNFYLEYFGYGASTGKTSNQLVYPAWSPELGALYTNPEVAHIPLGHNLTDKDIAITYSRGKTAYQRALGIRYTLFGNNSWGVRQVRLATEKEKGKIFSKTQITLIEGLRVIERAMRVEQGDMTDSEAEIITRKYGAQYLDELSSDDRSTVQYLLAKGILNFENHQEYANLNSPLSNSFAYKLIYRLANKEARLEFTKVTLTDSTGLPSDFQQVKQTLVTADLDKLSEVGSLTEGGQLIKNEDGEPLNLMSDFEFLSKSKKIVQKPEDIIPDRYVITSTIDDPLKYLYRSMPLVNVTADGKPKTKGVNEFEVYADKDKKMYNDVNVGEERYVGINSVKYDTTKERYLVEFYVFGEDYNAAVQFIKANLTTRIDSVTTESEETALVTAESGVVSGEKATEVADNITVSKDIVINETFDLTAYSNTDVSLVGNSVVDGSSTVKIQDKTMTAVNVLPKLTSQVAVDSLDPSRLVSVDIPQLNGNPINVFNPKGQIVGKTKVLEETLTAKPSGNAGLNYGFQGFDVNLLKSADYLMKDMEFTYTDSEGTKRKLNGSVILSWKLDLPSLKEQHALVGNLVQPHLTDISKSTWIFTEPDNISLKTLWDYNTGLNNALLKTVTGLKLEIPSGYFAPTVDIVIDSHNSTVVRNGVETNQDLTNKQISEIKNSFFNEVANNLPKSWLQMYVGSIALSNYVVGSKDEKGQIPKNVRNQVKLDQSTSTHTYIKPQGLLRGMLIPNGVPVWSHLVFNQERPGQYADTYLDNHSHMARFNFNTIYTIKDSIKYYGKYYADVGEGVTPELDILYAKDNFNNIYRDISKSDYTFNSSTESMQEETSYFRNSSLGQVIKNSNNEQWVVANETEYTYDLFSSKFTAAVVKDGKLVSTTSGDAKAPEILSVIHAANLASFGNITDGSVKSERFMLTRSFNFTPRKEDIARNTTFIAVRGGEMLPYQYVDVVLEDGSTATKLQSVKMAEGDVVQVPQFVSLYKSVWVVEGGVMKWNKTFVGANPESYIKGSLIQMMKEAILAANSPNIVMSQDIKGGTVDIGQLTADIKAKKTVFKVAVDPEMINEGKLNETVVLDKFNANSDVVILPDGTTASSAQYLTEKVAGGYDPTYEFYDNTLVVHDNKLKVASGTKLAEYTPNSSIQTVSITAMLMDGVRMLNYGGSKYEGNYKVYTYQDFAPSTVISPFTGGDVPTPNTGDAFIADVAEPFQGLPTALNIFSSLEEYLASIKVEETWHFFVYFFIGYSITMSITTLLAHVLAQAPVSNVILVRLFEVTGIDFPALMSFRAVQISDDSEPITWKRTVLTSAMLGISPVMVFAFMRMQGWL